MIGDIGEDNPLVELVQGPGELAGRRGVVCPALWLVACWQWRTNEGRIAGPGPTSVVRTGLAPAVATMLVLAPFPSAAAGD